MYLRCAGAVGRRFVSNAHVPHVLVASQVVDEFTQCACTVGAGAQVNDVVGEARVLHTLVAL